MFKLNRKINEFWRVLLEAALLCQYISLLYKLNLPDYNPFIYVGLGGAILGLYLGVTGAILGIWRICCESSSRTKLKQASMAVLQLLFIVGFVAPFWIGGPDPAAKYGPAVNADRMADARSSRCGIQA